MRRAFEETITHKTQSRNRNDYKDKMITLVNNKTSKSAPLYTNVQKNLPSWTEKDAREAFFSLGKFAVMESGRNAPSGRLGGKIQMSGIYKRFVNHIDDYPQDKGLKFIFNVVRYGVENMKFDPDEWLYELVDGVLGINYSIDGHVYSHIEEVVKLYLKTVLGFHENKNEFDIFSIEGLNVGIQYLVHSLMMNEILEKGDKVAVLLSRHGGNDRVPIFQNLELELIPIYHDSFLEDDSALVKENLQRLKDPDIKALFMINPNNQTMATTNRMLADGINYIVEHINPNLIVVSDEVYAPFIKDYHSFYFDHPKNTIGLYSFSKYFGASGWKLGTLMLPKENIIDEMISGFSQEKKERIDFRYKDAYRESRELDFMDRLMLDSRLLARKYVTGISTPQQVQMALFAMKALLDQNGIYRKEVNHLCVRRKKMFLKSMGIEECKKSNDSSYSAQFDLSQWMDKVYGNKISRLIRENYRLDDVVQYLIDKTSTVLIGEESTEDKRWRIKISMVNLTDEQYFHFERSLRKIMNHAANQLRRSIHYF